MNETNDFNLDSVDADLAKEIIQAWKTDPKLRADFGNIARYAAYRKAKAAGHVKILSGTVARGGAPGNV